MAKGLLPRPRLAIRQGLAGLILCLLLAEVGGVARSAYQSRAACVGTCEGRPENQGCIRLGEAARTGAEP